jgi:hypothetical protein
LPEGEFRLYAVCSRFPHNLQGEAPLEPVQAGVYDCRRGSDRIRVLVVGQLPEAGHNAPLVLFSASIPRRIPMRLVRSPAASAALVAVSFLIASACAADEKGKADKDKDKADFANIGDLNAEVTVLNVLHTLQPTAAQYAALLKASAKTMQKPPPRKKVMVSERFRKTLQSLREALVKNDGEKVDELFTKFDELRQKEDPEFDDVEITDAAREQAPKVLRLFSARQVAAYLVSVSDFPDPVERLLQAMDESRKLRGKEWQDLRDDTAYQVGWLVGGLNPNEEEKARDKAIALLNKAHALGEKGTKAERAALEKDARQLAAKLGPTDVLRHFMERVIAEALSNHRLAAAIEAMKK